MDVMITCVCMPCSACEPSCKLDQEAVRTAAAAADMCSKQNFQHEVVSKFAWPQEQIKGNRATAAVQC